MSKVLKEQPEQLFRSEIETLEQNAITRLVFPRIDDPDIIPLWLGEGDLTTPDFICEAAKRGLEAGDTFYIHTRGRRDLRDAIKDHLDGLYKIDLDPDRITVPGAAMMGMTLATQMALTTGAHALIIGPAWPNIENAMRVTGAEVEYLRQDLNDGRWQLDMKTVEAAVRDNTRAIFVNSPCNPTGWVMSRTEQQELLTLCRRRNILIIADEVYSRLVYDQDVAPSFVEIADDDDPVIVINGFSKSYAMTGWRLGWMVAPARYATLLTALSECFNTGSTAFLQTAGIVALEQGEDWVQKLRSQYAGGREIVMKVLGDHPSLELSAPHGSFYAFPHVPGLSSSWRLAERLADEAKVGVAAGVGFGPGNDEHFRICFAQSHERLEQGLQRIAGFLDARLNELIM